MIEMVGCFSAYRAINTNLLSLNMFKEYFYLLNQHKTLNGNTNLDWSSS